MNGNEKRDARAAASRRYATSPPCGTDYSKCQAECDDHRGTSCLAAANMLWDGIGTKVDHEKSWKMQIEGIFLDDTGEMCTADWSSKFDRIPNSNLREVRAMQARGICVDGLKANAINELRFGCCKLQNEHVSWDLASAYCDGGLSEACAYWRDPHNVAAAERSRAEETAEEHQIEAEAKAWSLQRAGLNPDGTKPTAPTTGPEALLDAAEAQVIKLQQADGFNLKEKTRVAFRRGEPGTCFTGCTFDAKNLIVVLAEGTPKDFTVTPVIVRGKGTWDNNITPFKFFDLSNGFVEGRAGIYVDSQGEPTACSMSWMVTSDDETRHYARCISMQKR